MGNRANVVFKQDNGYLGLYLHNARGDNKKDTASAVRRVVNAGRTSDIGYATRIAVSEMIGNYWSDNLSYGLYVGKTVDEAISDNEHDIILIDFYGGLVTIYDFDHRKWGIGDVKNKYSLLEFIENY